MKSCTYCGRSNADAAIRCFECGTDFQTTSQSAFALDHRPQLRVLNPELLTALKATGGFVLIASAVLMFASRMAYDMAVAAHGGPIGKPVIFAVGLLAFFYSAITLILLSPLLVAACIARCRAWGLVVSLVGFAILAALFFVRGLKFLLPACLLGWAVGHSWGYYVGAVIQFAVGTWLLLPFGDRP